MTFNINRFKSKINEYNGLAKNNLFEVEMYNADSSFMPVSSLKFFCQTVTVPGLNFAVSEFNPRGFGLPESMPVGMDKVPVNAVFLCDNDHRVMGFFHEWMNFIINYNTESGYELTNPRSSNQLPFELNYKKTYSVNMSIKHFSLDSLAESQTYYECKLGGVYPTQVSPSTFSWDATDFTTLTVNFSYSQILYRGNRQLRDIETASFLSSPANGPTLREYYKLIGENADAYQRAELVQREAARIRPFRSLS
jgi:hypothetical protein